jgi:hypothetical protein
MADLATLEISARALVRQIELIGKHVGSIGPGNSSRDSIDPALDAITALRCMSGEFIAQATLCVVDRRNMAAREGALQPAERAS